LNIVQIYFLPFFMIELFGLLLVLGLLGTLIVPWINLARISRVRSELKQLRRELRELKDCKDVAIIKKEGGASFVTGAEAKASELARAVTLERPVEKAKSEFAGSEMATPSGRSGLDTVSGAKGEKVRSVPRPVMSLHSDRNYGGVDLSSEAVPDSLETAEGTEPQDWFSKIAVWIGGIALLMAGFYMVKYSLDSGLLTPIVRICLTAGFGFLLSGAGWVIGVKSSMLANERIGQALSGAGIACLYFAAYAAVHLYGFLTPGQGFIVMLGVTVMAVFLSLKNGAPIAMMGLVGGFLTPWLMSTGANDTVMLFAYLFLLFCGAQFLCVHRGWWGLLFVSLLGAYLWSVIVVFGYLCGFFDQLEGTLFFVLGICSINGLWVFFTKQVELEVKTKRYLAAIRWVTWGGGLLQGLILVFIGGFATVDMLLFSLLSLAALVLAILREDEFIWAACVALVVVALSIVSNANTAIWSWFVVPHVLIGVFFVVGHWRGLRSDRGLLWRSLAVGAASIVVPLLYLNRVLYVSEVVGMAPWGWFVLALGWAGLLLLAAEHLLRSERDAAVAGGYSAFAVYLLGFGLWTYAPEGTLGLFIAMLLILSALYWKWRALDCSTWVLSVLGMIWCALMLQQGASACAYMFREDLYC
jgi:uncharacterized membrane protein